MRENTSTMFSRISKRKKIVASQTHFDCSKLTTPRTVTEQEALAKKTQLPLVGFNFCLVEFPFHFGKCKE